MTLHLVFTTKKKITFLTCLQSETQEIIYRTHMKVHE